MLRELVLAIGIPLLVMLLTVLALEQWPDQLPAWLQRLAAARQALEPDDQAVTDSGMLRGEIPSFAELLARISQLEEQCNPIPRSLA